MLYHPYDVPIVIIITEDFHPGMMIQRHIIPLPQPLQAQQPQQIPSSFPERRKSCLGEITMMMMKMM
jgi:hypothetical protein